jgi:hypothetical protein
MTLERKLMVGIEDIKGVCLECSSAECKTRVSGSLGAYIVIPTYCPQCKSSWIVPHVQNFEEKQSPPHRLVDAILDFNNLVGNLPFRIYLSLRSRNFN